MNKEEKRNIIIKTIQFLIYGISLIGAILDRGSSSNWPFFLLTIGIMMAYCIPVKYRSSFNSTAPGIILKNHTRRLENIIEITITFILIFLVLILDML